MGSAARDASSLAANVVGLALAAGLTVTDDRGSVGVLEEIASVGDDIDEVAAVDVVKIALDGPDLSAWVASVQPTSRPTHPISATNLNAPTTRTLSSTIIWSLGRIR
jgi:hypothetical protein